MASCFGPYRALVCDLDGVVYRGPAAVPHAVESLEACELPVVFATNNASRPPATVAEHLRALGLRAADTDVVNSSQAAAMVLAELRSADARVLAVGGDGVALALTEAGFRVVRAADAAGSCTDRDPVEAVVQGYGAGVTASDLAEAAYAVRAGATWIATNTDATLPTDHGIAPGNGSLITAVATAVGRGPDRVAGKPQAPIYVLAARRLGLPVTDLLAIGDRLDTDIAGARVAGLDSLLVLTGIDTIDSLVRAEPGHRPTWVSADLRSLVDPSHHAHAVELTRRVASCWTAVDRGGDPAALSAEIAALEVLRRNAADG